MLRRFSSGGLVSGGGLGSFEGLVAFLCGSQLFCHLGSGKGLASVRAFLDTARGNVDALGLVDLDYVDTLRETSKVLDELSGTFGKGGAHNRAFCSLFGKFGEAGEARRGRGAQSAERGRLRTTQEGARRGELCKRRELVHYHRDIGERKSSGEEWEQVLYIRISRKQYRIVRIGISNVLIGY